MTVRAVTRGQARKLAENKVHDEDVHVSTSDPQSFDDDDSEFGRLAAIDMSYTPPSVGAGSVDSSASGVDLLKGSDEDGNNEGGEGSADSDGQLGVSPPKLDCNLLPNTTVSPEPCSSSSSNSADELLLAPPELAEGVNDLKRPSLQTSLWLS